MVDRHIGPLKRSLVLGWLVCAALVASLFRTEGEGHRGDDEFRLAGIGLNSSPEEAREVMKRNGASYRESSNQHNDSVSLAANHVKVKIRSGAIAQVWATAVPLMDKDQVLVEPNESLARVKKILEERPLEQVCASRRYAGSVGGYSVVDNKVEIDHRMIYPQHNLVVYGFRGRVVGFLLASDARELTGSNDVRYVRDRL